MVILGRKPHLFLTYARRESGLALAVSADLARRGFDVFLDQSAIQEGDDFVRSITERLRKVDAVIALLTVAACDSAWCQAELHHARALGKRIIPVFWPESRGKLSDPLQRLLRDIQHVVVQSDSAPAVVGGIAEQLALVRGARRRRFAVRALLALLGIAGLLAAGQLGLDRINAISADRERNKLLAELQAASTVLPQRQMDTYSKRWQGDETVRSQLLALAANPTIAAVTQLNAALLAHAVTPNASRPFRSLKNVQWEGGTVKSGQLMDITFASGSLSGVSIEDSHLANVHFGGDERDGLRMSDVTVQLSRMFGGSIQPANAMNVHFRGVKLLGTRVDITNFSLSSFAPRGEPEKDPHIITSDYALFDGANVVSRIDPPAAGVIDLSRPEHVVIFKQVRFVNTRFEGWFNPAWFRDCEFEASELPPSLTPALLAKQGNIISVGRTRKLQPK